MTVFEKESLTSIICPRCNFEQNAGGSECPKCGIVFSRYRPPDDSPRDELRGASSVMTASAEQHAAENRTNCRELFLPGSSPQDLISVVGRAVLLILLVIWGMKFVLSSLEGNYAGGSFMHLVNLPFHEAGHVLFGLFGSFLAVLGGSLLQVLVPMICLWTLLLKNRDPFAASVSFWWFGESLIDLAPYINDARPLKLMLLGGVTGRDVDDYHDWEFILRSLGLLEYDHILGLTVHLAGALCMVAAMSWGGLVLLLQYRGYKPE